MLLLPWRLISSHASLIDLVAVKPRSPATFTSIDYTIAKPADALPNVVSIHVLSRLDAFAQPSVDAVANVPWGEDVIVPILMHLTADDIETR